MNANRREDRSRTKDITETAIKEKKGKLKPSDESAVGKNESKNVSKRNGRGVMKNKRRAGKEKDKIYNEISYKREEKRKSIS